ncbi:MAG TPA: exodeoxyribonuclease VII small subunit [Gemmatirosa sp.]
MSFEDTLDRLHEIVAALESDALPLDAALQLFEEGVARLRDAGGELARVDAKLSLLVELADGSFELADVRR